MYISGGNQIFVVVELIYGISYNIITLVTCDVVSMLQGKSLACLVFKKMSISSEMCNILE
jgi:hypothetical protein